ncbi:MAG: hypothetical protein L0I76_09910 [Pseudonocardia sp.]|nr:hypothetical protein [Pseudonocardia sp.]
MAHIAAFHHAQGLTAGVRSFADQLTADGHDVAVPDLYDGARFDSFSEGVAHAEQVGFGSVIERGRAAAADLPSETIYIGFSLGVLPAQMLAQTRPGAREPSCVIPAFRRPSSGDLGQRGSHCRSTLWTTTNCSSRAVISKQRAMS